MTCVEIFELFFSQIYGVVKTFSIMDLLDIAVIAYITYVLIKLVRETRAGQLVKGILLLTVFYFIAVQFNLKTTGFLLKNIFQIGILALIILFQPEIRRALEKAGRTKMANLNIFNVDGDPAGRQMVWEHCIDEICEAAKTLSKDKTGTLVVIERKTRLGEQIDTGVLLNATVSEELLLNIFFKNTPLHDGAVIIRDGSLLAAACFLPKPQREELIETNFGSRHRAAIGISEVSDAITVVVSEETGTISVTESGQIIRNFTPDSLRVFLRAKLIPEPDEGKKATKVARKFAFWRAKKK